MLKPIPKKDQPKVIALSVLVAGLAGTAYMQLSAGDERLAEAQKVAAARAAEKGKTTPPVGTPIARTTPIVPTGTTAAASGLRPTTPGLVSPVSATGGAAVAGVDASAARVVGDNGSVFDLGAVGPPVGGKDPFQTKAPTVATTVVSAPAPTPTPAALPDNKPRNSSGAAGRLGRLLDSAGITSTVPNKVSRGGGVSIDEVMNGGGASAPGAASVPTYVPTAANVVVSLPPPPPPAVMVSGIVLGVSEPGNPSNGSVAMLRSGDLVSGGAAASTAVAERRFVRVGDNVGNGFVVAQIYSDSVIIKSGKRRFTLYLGVKPEWLATSTPGTANYAPAYAPTGNYPAPTGKDAAQSADKNTSNNYYAPAALNPSAPAANRAFGNPAVSAAASPAGSQIGESFRAK